MIKSTSAFQSDFEIGGHTKTGVHSLVQSRNESLDNGHVRLWDNRYVYPSSTGQDDIAKGRAFPVSERTPDTPSGLRGNVGINTAVGHISRNRIIRNGHQCTDGPQGPATNLSHYDQRDIRAALAKPQDVMGMIKRLGHEGSLSGGASKAKLSVSPAPAMRDL